MREAAEQARQGITPAEVLTADRMLMPLGIAWGIAERSGVALAEVIGHVAEDIDAELERGRAVSLALAGPRATAFMLSGLPVLGLALGHAMGARPLSFLLGEGRVVTAIGLALDAGGLWWTQRMIARALR
jgi:tight adherence protein B